MVDTLTLYTEEYSKRQGANFPVTGGGHYSETGEIYGEFPLISDAGGTIWGNKIVENRDNWQADIKAKGNIPRLTVKMSIPKYYNKGENYHPVNGKQAGEVLNHIQGELAEWGVLTNVSDMKISRLDTFRNVETKENFHYYARIFEILECSRKEKRQYHNGFLLKNNQEQFCFYDKITEMRKEQKLDVSGYPANVIRGEVREINHKKVASVYGIDTAKEFICNYGNLREYYPKALKTVFKHSPEEIAVMGGKELKKTLEYFNQNYGKRWKNEFKKQMGLRYIIEHIGTDAFLFEYEKYLNEHSFKTVYLDIHRVKNELHKTELSINKTSGKIKKITNVDLYKELRSKFLKKVA